MRFKTDLSRKWYIYGSQLVSLIFIWMMLLSPAWSAQVTLSWNSNNEPNIAGYKMNYGQFSRNYQYSTNLGNHTTCTISGLQEGKTYYFAATAYDTNNNESGFSEEVAYTVPFPGSGSSVMTWIEAEDGDLHAPMKSATEASASAGEFIRVTSGSGGYSQYSFNIPESGTYFIWGRALGHNGMSNSFYISTGNGGDVEWRFPVSTNWRWDQALSAYFTAGQHTLKIKQRERRSQLDKILITSDPAYVPQGIGGETTPQLWLEAEDGDLHAPMKSATDSNASSGEFIRVTSGSGGYSQYSFNIPESGTYFIWGRALGHNGMSNSFYISTGNGGDVEWRFPVSTNWRWDQALSAYFTAGQHTLKIKQRERRSQLDKILITSDPAYVPQGIGGETTPQLWLEAEDGDLHAPMKSATDSNASSGEFIRVTSGSGGYSQYSFNIPESGTYFIWGRVLGRTGGSNSFYISTDNGGDVEWRIPVSTNWKWDQALSAYFTAGQHTLKIKQRERRTQLDKILITNEPDYIPN